MPIEGEVPVEGRFVVLVVDDDPDICRSVLQALDDGGMMGVDAATGQEALRILSVDPTIRLLLTDIVMPGIAGTTLAERAAAIRPDVKVMFMTGYDQPGPVAGNRPVLGKPFGSDALCATIRAAWAAD